MSLRILPTLALVGSLAACGGASPETGSAAAAVSPLKVVATPNPNVFPLLVALARDAKLPATLVPIGDGAEIDAKFASGEAEALLSMTYTAAKKVIAGKTPGLQLHQAFFWRGFTEMTPQADNVTSFQQLVGKGLLVTGPTAGGKNGGPDLIFQAAIKRAGYTVADFKICYLPVLEAAPMIAQQQLMNSNAACDPSFNFPPSGISLVEPAATGLAFQTTIPMSGTQRIVKSIDFQALFTGYTAWPSNQLPHGGFSVLQAVADNAMRTATVDAVLKAYAAGANEIAAAKGNPAATNEIATVISNGIKTYYGQYGLDLPAQVIGLAITQGELVFRTDLKNAALQNDLNGFLTEVVGSAPPASFYRP